MLKVKIGVLSWWINGELQVAPFIETVMHQKLITSCFQKKI